MEENRAEAPGGRPRHRREKEAIIATPQRLWLEHRLTLVNDAIKAIEELQYILTHDSVTT